MAKSEYKAPPGGNCGPDGSRSPYQDSPMENRTSSYPKGRGDFKGRGGYPERPNPTVGGYPAKRK